MNQRREVFLLCSRRPIVGEFYLLAEALAQTTDLVPVLVVPPGLLGSVPQPLPEGCRTVSSNAATWKAAGTGSFAMYVLFAVVRRLNALLRRARIRFPADFLETWEAVSRGRWFARRILRVGKGTAAVLTADDRDIRFDQGVLIEARRGGVFTLAAAFGKSDATADMFRRAAPEYHVDLPPWRWLKAKIAAAYPVGVRTNHQNKRISFFRPGEHLALSAQESLFPAPWSYGGGTADKVCVIDHHAAAVARELGVSPGKILVAGQCSHDNLWSMREQRGATRKRLDAECNFDPSAPLVILALPVLGEHGMTSIEDQLNETLKLFQTMAQVAGRNVLVSLHPRQERSHYERLASTCGLTISAAPLRDVLAAADLFVAYSSTISWAQLLGIPSVALEYYNLGYTLFTDEPGVLAVSTREWLADACIDALQNGGTRHELLAQLKAAATNTPFDGQVRQRFTAEIRTAQKRGSKCVSSG